MPDLKISKNLQNQYENYYNDKNEKWRSICAKEKGDNIKLNPYDNIPIHRKLIDKKNPKVGLFDLGNHVLIAGFILVVIFISLNVE